LDIKELYLTYLYNYLPTYLPTYLLPIYPHNNLSNLPISLSI